MLVQVEKQLATAQREVIALAIKCSATREDEKVRLKQERAVLFERREDELLLDMQLHLVKGRAEMQKQTVEAAEGAVAGLKADLACAEGDRYKGSGSALMLRIILPRCKQQLQVASPEAMRTTSGRK